MPACGQPPYAAHIAFSQFLALHFTVAAFARVTLSAQRQM
jgi:hypothetical protein